MAGSLLKTPRALVRGRVVLGEVDQRISGVLSMCGFSPGRGGEDKS